MKKIVVFLLIILLAGCSKKKISFVINENIELEVYKEVKLSSLFSQSNVELIDDYTISSNELGNKEYSFKYKENNEIKEGKFNINIVDKTKPVIMQGKNLTVELGYKKKLESVLMSADNYDSNPKREIIGNYDFNKEGDYELEYKVTDKSGNIETQKFTLHVKKPNNSYSNDYTSFKEIKEKYKNNKVGIDISFWQGNVDFNKLKASGVDFVMIRMGTQLGFDKESELDSKFIQNIKKANEVGIDVGIYYYSYAKTKKEAKKQALFVIDNIKNYKIDLPVAFDWESFSKFNELNLSLHDFNEINYEFLNTIKENGYKTYLYGSRNYLTDVFDPKDDVWLAHYTKETDYKGEYKMWQLCNNGKVDGINGYVDIDILYE